MAAALAGAPGLPGAGEVMLSGAPGLFSVPVRSLKEDQFRDVVRQRYDFSCGSAALATLLTYHYQRPTSEQDVFAAMWEHGDQVRISEAGFSLLDMKGYLAGHGLAADGFRVPLDKLEEAQIPAIALIDTGGYKHFVVIKGVQDDQVLLGDPALGRVILPRPQFEAIWNGILFVLRSEGETAREHFNQEDAWQLVADAPLPVARFREDLGSFTINLPSRGEF